MEKVKEVKERDVVAEAQALLQEKEKERINAFIQEYQELSKKHGLGWSPVLTIKANGIEPNLEVVKV